MDKKNTPYMPPSGTDGIIFTEMWCDKCSRRALDPSAKTQCIHELNAFFYGKNDKWFYIDGVPTCIAFRDRKLKKRYRKVDKRQLKLCE